MRWPFVSRDIYDRHFAYWERMYDNAQTRCHEQRTAYDALLEKYHALKLEGASVVPTYTGYIEAPLSVDEADALRVEQEQEDG